MIWIAIAIWAMIPQTGSHLLPQSLLSGGARAISCPLQPERVRIQPQILARNDTSLWLLTNATNLRRLVGGCAGLFKTAPVIKLARIITNRAGGALVDQSGVGGVGITANAAAGTLQHASAKPANRSLFVNSCREPRVVQIGLLMPLTTMEPIEEYV